MRTRRSWWRVLSAAEPVGDSRQSWLRDGGVPPLFAHNLRLFYARWLVHESLFDEAQEQLSGLRPGRRGRARHAVVLPERGRTTPC